MSHVVTNTLPYASRDCVLHFLWQCVAAAVALHSTNTGCVVSFLFGHSNRCVVMSCLIVLLICISLRASDADLLFKGL